MRIAFVDLLFSWPPHGGADVDLYHVIAGLQAEGHEARLFGASDPSIWERGAFEPDALPFPAERLDFQGSGFNRVSVASRLREAVDAWGPEAVFVGDGFFLKPYVIMALSHYPVAARYFAYEVDCHRDILRFKSGAPCPNRYLETPELCRRCALDHLASQIKHRHHRAWTQEYLAAHAFAPDYFRVLNDSLKLLRAAVVYNALMRQHVQHRCPQVFIVPGGVDTGAFAYTPAPERSNGNKKMILMTGRAEDPAKGLSVLLDAGERLAQVRDDFEIQATAPLDMPARAWYRPLGWRDHEETAALYRQADICVIPSVWDEPFGLVALEAMASGRPVCASRVGGLRGIVDEDESGFLFERGDGAELAGHLTRLLDDGALRQRMGKAGRDRAEDQYSWKQIVARHYPQVLAALRG